MDRQKFQSTTNIRNVLLHLKVQVRGKCFPYTTVLIEGSLRFPEWEISLQTPVALLHIANL